MLRMDCFQIAEYSLPFLTDCRYPGPGIQALYSGYQTFSLNHQMIIAREETKSCKNSIHSLILFRFYGTRSDPIHEVALGFVRVA